VHRPPRKFVPPSAVHAAGIQIGRIVNRLATVAMLLSFNGCAALIIADSISSSSTKTQHQQFVANFNQMNQIRRGQGLQALDWCSECYRFDRKWSMQDPACKARVKRYEKGDTLALQPAGEVRLGSAVDSVPYRPPSLPKDAPDPRDSY